MLIMGLLAPESDERGRGSPEHDGEAQCLHHGRGHPVPPVWLGLAVADPLILAYIIYYRSAPILPVIGSVMDGSTPIGVLGGLDAVIALGFVLVAVAVLEAVAGFWLSRSLKKGGKLGAVLAPLDLFFAFGFGIPILYVLAPLRTLLLVMGWKSLR